MYCGDVMYSEEGISLIWLVALIALTTIVAGGATLVFGIFGGLGVFAGALYLGRPPKNKK